MIHRPVVSKRAEEGKALSPEAVAETVREACPPNQFKDRRLLVIIPDGTRSAPVGLVFKTLYASLESVVARCDVMVALGTHQPMTEEAICRRLDMTLQERQETYGQVQFFNHEWNNPNALREVGVIAAKEIHALTAGRFSMDVPVEVNAKLFEYDDVMILGPVFPHEVVGFSGGYKYLFPGVAGPRILNFFHWLGAVVTNPMIIGNKWTPVRKVVDRAGAMVALDKHCFCMVVAPDKSLTGLFAGDPEGAWDAASDLSKSIHIEYKDKPFHTVLSCAPSMYDELWVGGKCMYKLEPVVADGGELIIYAPHIEEVCLSHGETIMKVGYHCRDYFLKQWDRFKDYPWGVLAHSTHVYGLGSFENGVETPRIRVTLATGIPESVCRQINLGFRDWRTIDVESYAEREAEGVLCVRQAGEKLFQLKNPPEWAGGSPQAQ